MPRTARVVVIAGIALVAVAAVWILVPPVPQDFAYHFFADVRVCFGIPNCGDATSSALFAAVGILGLAKVLKRRTTAFAAPGDWAPFAAFFLGIALVGPGSIVYHLAPDNETLVWDRLPMTMAFAALAAAAIADRIGGRLGGAIALPVLLVVSWASVVYWIAGERAGQGDLRFYGLVQFLPVVLLPVICRLFPEARHTGGRYLAAIVALYAAAKAFEHFDYEVYEALGERISGHTLKHLAAAAAAYLVLPMALTAKTGSGAAVAPPPAPPASNGPAAT